MWTPLFPSTTSVISKSTAIELQDREFFAAIREKREPNASVAQRVTAMDVLDRIERLLNSAAKATA